MPIYNPTIAGVIGSDATYTSGTVQFTGSGAATVQSSANQRIVVNVPVQSTQVVVAVSASDVLYSSGTVIISGGANITVGTSAGGKVTISGAAAAAGGPALVASNTTYTGGTITITGSNAITVRSAASQIVVDFTQSVQTQNLVAVAASNTTFTSGTVAFTGSGGIVIGSGAQSAVVSYSAPALSEFIRGPEMSAGPIRMADKDIYIVRLRNDEHNMWRQDYTDSTQFHFFSVSGTSAISIPFTSTLCVGIYTQNGSSLSLLNSASVSWGDTASNANNSTQWNGVKAVSIHSSVWSSSPVYKQGSRYYMAVQVATGATSNSMSAINVGMGNSSSFLNNFSGLMGGSTGTHQSQQPRGIFVGGATTNASGMPTNIANSLITGIGAKAQIYDGFILMANSIKPIT